MLGIAAIPSRLLDLCLIYIPACSSLIGRATVIPTVCATLRCILSLHRCTHVATYSKSDSCMCRRLCADGIASHLHSCKSAAQPMHVIANHGCAPRLRLPSSSCTALRQLSAIIQVLSPQPFSARTGVLVGKQSSATATLSPTWWLQVPTCGSNKSCRKSARHVLTGPSR